MKDTTATLYEAPKLIDAGDFAKVTLGRNSWGFDSSMLCRWINCQPA
ncbi:keywimysin-related RiPP [Streptomyces spiramenti]|uniref:Lasso RiPP family leader peptide-containing protein n=1 Tax=Streptomyces spiramenti TaxID=2720606 RepID=A0ABX1AJP2_9ACTN|nr:keywimysin-related RiPP [Streptomyces spiramenti]NJP65871.1 lasso RiPP family leader peptide-containing protein [Streptomyces spiramenti]